MSAAEVTRYPENMNLKIISAWIFALSPAFVWNSSTLRAGEFGVTDDRQQTRTLRPNTIKKFYGLQNPNGNAYSLRLTAELEGNGELLSLSASSHDGAFHALGLFCEASEAKYCRKYIDLGGCGNLGPLVVSVEYTGDVEPRLKYWFFDC
jgi:hypothetical protein